MNWEVQGTLNGKPIVLTHETDDDCTRAEAQSDMLHSIPTINGEFKGFPKVDWRTLKADKPKLTDADRDALSVLPDGWFLADQVPYPRVKRADYRLQRLIDACVVERQFFGELLNKRPHYRKIGETVCG